MGRAWGSGQDRWAGQEGALRKPHVRRAGGGWHHGEGPRERGRRSSVLSVGAEKIENQAHGCGKGLPVLDLARE